MILQKSSKFRHEKAVFPFSLIVPTDEVANRGKRYTGSTSFKKERWANLAFKESSLSVLFFTTLKKDESKASPPDL
jgi:hypothetical protein